MHSLLLAGLCASFVATTATPVDKEEPPAKKDLFAMEDWYKDQKGDETKFVGVLEKRKGGGGIGIVQRFNPYVLVSGDRKREVYVGGKNDILDAYVGKKVQLTGKAVDMELEGRSFHEIWPARIERVADKDENKPDAKKDEKKDSDKGEAGMNVKIVGRGSWHPAGKGEPQLVVIRTAEELAKAAGLEKPEEEATQKKATETVAKALNVDDIDWKKEMVIAVSAGMKTTGGYRVEVTKIDVADKVLTVHWTLHMPGPRSPVTATITHPAQSVVVERFAGKVVFDQTTAKGGDKEK